MVVPLPWHSTSCQDSFFTTVFLRYSSTHPLHAKATHSWRHCWSDWFQSVVWSHLFSHLRGSADDGNTCFRLAFVDSNAGVLIRRVSTILLQTYNYSSSCDVIGYFRTSTSLTTSGVFSWQRRRSFSLVLLFSNLPFSPHRDVTPRNSVNDVTYANVSLRQFITGRTTYVKGPNSLFLLTMNDVRLFRHCVVLKFCNKSKKKLKNRNSTNILSFVTYLLSML